MVFPLVLVVFVFLGILGTPGTVVEMRDQALLFGFLGTCLFFFGCVECFQKGKRIPAPSLLSGGLGLLLLWSAGGWFYSVYVDTSFAMAVKDLGAFLWFLTLLMILNRQDTLETWFRFWMLMGLAHGLFSLLNQLAHPAETANWSSIFGNQNFYAHFLFLPLFLAAYFYLHHPRERGRWLGGAAYVLILLNLGFSSSRGGLLSAGAALVLLAFYLWHRRLRRELYSLGRGAMVAVACYFALQGLLAVLRWSQGLENPLSLNVLERGLEVSGTLAKRMVFWKTAWAIFLDHPFTGTGPWTYRVVYPFYESTYAELAAHAHNLFLQTFSEQGLVGGVLLLLVVAGLVRAGGRVLGKPDSPSAAPFVFAALAAQFIHNQIEYCWPTPVYLFIVAFEVAAVDFWFRQAAPQGARPARWLPVAGLTIGMISFIMASRFYFYEEIRRQLQEEPLTLTILEKETAEARRYCPRCHFPYLWAAAGFLSYYEQSQDPVFLERAEKALDSLRPQARFDANYRFVRGWLYELKRDWTEARSWYRAYLDLRPRDPRVVRALARIQKKLNGPVP